MPPGVRQPYRGITEYVELLGLQTYGKERRDPGFARRRPVFSYAPVIELHKLELPALLGLLHRNEGITLDRGDKNLFDEELETLLKKFGPLVWPEPGQGNRDHLRMPQEGTLYTSDIVYPRDTAILKEHMRGIILCKRVSPGVNVDALITKTQRDSRLKIFRDVGFTEVTPLKRKSLDMSRKASPRFARHTHPAYCENETDAADDSSEDANVGMETRHQTRKKSKYLPESPFKVKLRLYRKTTQKISPSPGPVWPYGTMFLTTEWTTSEYCFSRICEKIESDCSFVIFQLPEDMSPRGQLRLDRGSEDSEATFQRILGIFQKARKFGNELQHRSVEVEVGLDLSEDDWSNC
ncbi:Nn.00g089640.m01.CDS01 [Neocucurbitaria sp. VM-36]